MNRKNRTELELCGLGSSRSLVSRLTVTKNSYLLNVNSFYRAMLCMHKRSLCRHAVSVRPSVTFVDHPKTNKHIFEIFSPPSSHTILAFLHQTGWRYSDGNAPNGGVECRRGISRNRDSGLIAGYRRLLDVRSAKNIYRRRS